MVSVHDIIGLLVFLCKSINFSMIPTQLIPNFPV